MRAGNDIIDVTKTYEGTTRAVDAVNMSIREGEFFSLLGPSGCGKTTTLRMIAGFETPTKGTIEVGGADVTHVPAHKRDMGMVFQNYALFPHRSVGENVAFGLRMRGMDRTTIAHKVAEGDVFSDRAVRKQRVVLEYHSHIALVRRHMSDV